MIAVNKDKRLVIHLIQQAAEHCRINLDEAREFYCLSHNDAELIARLDNNEIDQIVHSLGVLPIKIRIFDAGNDEGRPDTFNQSQTVCYHLVLSARDSASHDEINSALRYGMSKTEIKRLASMTDKHIASLITRRESLPVTIRFSEIFREAMLGATQKDYSLRAAALAVARV